MRPQLASPTCLAGAVLVLSLSGCAGLGRTPPLAEREPVASRRPFSPFVEGRWIGNAICYGPYRDGQRPGGAVPTAAEIREDLHLMARHWSLLRTYGSSEFGRTLLAQIRASGIEMKVMLGVWIAAEQTREERGVLIEDLPGAAAANRREIAAAIELAAAYPDIVVAICVGNETQVYWSPYPCPIDLLIDAIRQVRAAVLVPVTTADDYHYWTSPPSRELAREVDFLTVHAHPLWNGRQLEDAMPWLQEQVTAIEALHPEPPVVIGETGWATSVADVGEEARLIRGMPGETQQASFYAAVRAWAAARRMPTFIFEAFDENWKGGDNPAEVEKHWGLFRADRTAKTALSGDQEDAPAAAR